MCRESMEGLIVGGRTHQCVGRWWKDLLWVIGLLNV